MLPHSRLIQQNGAGEVGAEWNAGEDGCEHDKICIVSESLLNLEGMVECSVE